ncbi:MAG: hypothetical protein QM742_12170 [Aquabacterium sp.]
MSANPLKGLIMRTAVVRAPGLGYIYAADPKKEADEVPHAITFRFKDQAFTQGQANFDAHSITVIAKPEVGLIAVSGAGYYSAILGSGSTAGDIFDHSAPPPANKRTGGIRSVATIDGAAYAIGLRGAVYRFDKPKQWARIDDGLPETFDGQALDGFSAKDIYAVGRQGQLWQFNGSAWVQRDLPTSVNLTSVKCAGNGRVYIAGHHGVLIEGRDDAWRVIDHGATEDNIWDLEWFGDRLYVSTMKELYQLDDGALVPVDFGADRPKSFYQLSATPEVMWSNGEFDLMSFDGKSWSRIV